MQGCPDELSGTIEEGQAIQVSGPFIGHFHIHHLDGTITTMPQILPKLLAFPASHTALPFIPPEPNMADLHVVQDFFEEPVNDHSFADDSSDDADDEDDGFDDTEESEVGDDGWYTPASSISAPVAVKSPAPASFAFDVHASDDEWEVQALVAAAANVLDGAVDSDSAGETSEGERVVVVVILAEEGHPSNTISRGRDDPEAEVVEADEEGGDRNNHGTDTEEDEDAIVERAGHQLWTEWAYGGLPHVTAETDVETGEDGVADRGGSGSGEGAYGAPRVQSAESWVDVVDAASGEGGGGELMAGDVEESGEEVDDQFMGGVDSSPVRSLGRKRKLEDADVAGLPSRKRRSL